MRSLGMRFSGILRSSNPGLVEYWIDDAIELPWSNGQAEGQVNRLKTLNRAMYGRAGPELMRARMLPRNHTL